MRIRRVPQAPIRTDANQLELALLNIALNARDAMPDRGRLQIAVRLENVKAGSVRSLNAGEHVRIIDPETGLFWVDDSLNYPRLMCEARTISALQRKIARLFDTNVKNIERKPKRV
jgi:hypothetical protein